MSVPGAPIRARAKRTASVPIPVADFERVDNISFRFRHLLPFGIANDAGDVHGSERNIVHELQAEHHHARDPEEDDVVCRNQQGCRIERFQIVGLIRPAES